MQDSECAGKLMQAGTEPLNKHHPSALGIAYYDSLKYVYTWEKTLTEMSSLVLYVFTILRGQKHPRWKRQWTWSFQDGSRELARRCVLHFLM